jgi:predicted DCC family thiol-disulfide oxidoreductase YuxK
MSCSTWLLYDAECPFCTKGAHIFRPSLEKRNCRIRPLQSHTAMKLLNIREGDYLPEMKVIGKDRKVYGGARAIIYLSQRIWWASPLWAFSHLPPIMKILDYVYGQIAKRRYCHGACET